MPLAWPNVYRFPVRSGATAAEPIGEVPALFASRAHYRSYARTSDLGIAIADRLLHAVLSQV
jgi:hypothetical protein